MVKKVSEQRVFLLFFELDHGTVFSLYCSENYASRESSEKVRGKSVLKNVTLPLSTNHFIVS